MMQVIPQQADSTGDRRLEGLAVAGTPFGVAPLVESTLWGQTMDAPRRDADPVGGQPEPVGKHFGCRFDDLGQRLNRIEARD